jgi:hypothetical protein
MCTAVGSYSTTGDGDDQDSRTLVEVTTSGADWTVVPSSRPGTGYRSVLLSVACNKPTDCLAVGDYSPTGDPYKPDYRNFVEASGETGWSVVESPFPDKTNQSQLESISCATARTCLAVGVASGVPQVAQGLVESWDGVSWAIVPTPARGQTYNGVSCPSTASCMVVGDAATPTHPLGQAIARMWKASMPA